VKHFARKTIMALAVVFIGASNPSAAQNRADTMYATRDVTFQSGGETIVGKLFLPAGDGPHPAVAVMGPVAFVKEQSPLQYASRLARAGVAALIFDPRYHGASGGEPRRFESGEAKIEDLQAALGFLAEQHGIAADRLGILGICQGVNWAIEATIGNSRVQKLGLVAGHYLSPATARMYLGDDDNIAARKRRSDEARQTYKDTGEATYIPIVGTEDALLTARPVAEWYLPWAEHAPWFAHRGTWENRITAMSEASIWGWRIDETVTRLRTPVLMIHGDKAASGPDIPRALFQRIPAEDKSLIWVDGANQLQFYEDPLVIDRALDPLADFFKG
jgi:hypothetical protein